MAGPSSKRRSRKRRGSPAGPRSVPSQRREQRVGRRSETSAPERSRITGLDARGPRPESPFGGLPVSELLILVGAIAVVVGFVTGGVALIVGIVVCALGVLEVTAREHFTGYRSHALLLAAYPSVAVEVALVAVFGSKPSTRPLLIVVVVPLFALLAWLLRGRYRVASHARSVRSSVRP